MPDTIIVTGCDANHDDLVQELLASLHAIEGRDFAIGFIRLGEAEVPRAILSRVDKAMRAAGGAGVPGPGEGFLISYLGVKARLPEMFPGYETYVWLDGDTWVQNAAGLREIVAAAGAAGDFAVATETGPNYWQCSAPGDYTLSTYLTIYGEADTHLYSRIPMINTGVIAARAGSPLWAAWGEALTDARTRQQGNGVRFYCDQIPLHRIVARGLLTPHPLRTVNNWLACFAPPLMDFKAGKLRASSLPWEEINIVHLAGKAKTEEYPLDDGSGRMVSFRYSRVRALLGLDAAPA